MISSKCLDGDVDRISAENGIVLFDVIDPRTQLAVGRQILRLAEREGRLVAVISSGVEYALLGAWAEMARLPGHATFPTLTKTKRIAVVSGSCSPTTERQIRNALSQGFDGIAVDPLDLTGDELGANISRIVERGLAMLNAGRSAISISAFGGDFDRSQGLRNFRGRGTASANRSVGLRGR